MEGFSKIYGLEFIIRNQNSLIDITKCTKYNIIKIFSIGIIGQKENWRLKDVE